MTIARHPFSDALEDWVQHATPRSIGSLGDVFAEKAFAVTIMLLLFVSAAPIPTGGVTLGFQIAAALLAGQMVLGRRTLWLPARWKHRELGARTSERVIPWVIRRIRWFERHTRPRWSVLYRLRPFNRLLGLIMLTFAIVASLAPPLSGLEVLPAMGAVVVALSIVLEDIVVFVVGIVIGTGGVLLFLAVGAAVFRALSGWL